MSDKIKKYWLYFEYVLFLFILSIAIRPYVDQLTCALMKEGCGKDNMGSFRVLMPIALMVLVTAISFAKSKSWKAQLLLLLSLPWLAWHVNFL